MVIDLCTPRIQKFYFTFILVGKWGLNYACFKLYLKRHSFYWSWHSIPSYQITVTYIEFPNIIYIFLFGDILSILTPTQNRLWVIFFFFSHNRLRKNLKSFIIVHPSWFIRTILAITRPFIRYGHYCSKSRHTSF